MTNAPSKESIKEALRQIEAPGGGDIVSQGLLSEIVISSGKVYFSISIQPEQAKAFEPARQKAEALVKGMPGVKAPPSRSPPIATARQPSTPDEPGMARRSPQGSVRAQQAASRK
jgi:ATP-binding protein involved in chromosome partitioning